MDLNILSNYFSTIKYYSGQALKVSPFNFLPNHQKYEILTNIDSE